MPTVIICLEEWSQQLTFEYFDRSAWVHVFPRAANEICKEGSELLHELELLLRAFGRGCIEGWVEVKHEVAKCTDVEESLDD